MKVGRRQWLIGFSFFRRSVVRILKLLGGFLLLSLLLFGFFSLPVGLFVVHGELVLVVKQQGLGSEVWILLGQLFQPTHRHLRAALACGSPHTGEIGARAEILQSNKKHERSVYHRLNRDKRSCHNIPV